MGYIANLKNIRSHKVVEQVRWGKASLAGAADEVEGWQLHAVPTSVRLQFAGSSIDAAMGSDGAQIGRADGMHVPPHSFSP